QQPDQYRKGLLELATTAPVESLPASTIVVLATSLCGVGGFKEAEGLLRRGHALHPGDFWINYHLGSSVRLRRDQSFVFLRSAQAIHPECGFVLNNLGVAEEYQGHIEEAIALYRRAVAVDPHCSLFHTNLGHALGQRKMTDEAVAALHQAIALNPKDIRPH